MAKRKSSPALDLIEIVAWLPWWVGVSLAIASYLWLHGVATTPMPVTSDPAQIAHFTIVALYRSAAGVGQYVLPIIFLAGAGLSAWQRHRGRSLAASVASSESTRPLEDISWQQFEQLVGEAFRQQGYSVIERGGAGADGGIDLVLRKAGRKYLVQCKQWKSTRVGVAVIRELYGVMKASAADGGFVVTSGRFTDEARAFAKQQAVVLIEGAQLETMLRRAAAKSEPAPAQAVGEDPQAPAEAVKPICPLCSSAMTRREAKRGAHAGRSFWGCTAYPKCRGTRPS
ncbi:restriction endonuclease [Eleftheria terrae]|uniref:restriction endonuclease n=1 Tax=Eleftheria terrae TaxID=1597781 RepID=UPI00263BAF2A|nr:restriction endonuclease [Eleftheria terrae]WKB50841.1 restriction endonuclease [Eleftheria terrae]